MIGGALLPRSAPRTWRPFLDTVSARDVLSLPALLTAAAAFVSTETSIALARGTAYDKDLAAKLQRVYALEFGIESSWLGMAPNYGIVVTVIETAGIPTFLRSVFRANVFVAFTVCLFSLALVSKTASLLGKTTTFAVVALVVLFLRKDAAAPRLARRVGVSSVHGFA